MNVDPKYEAIIPKRDGKEGKRALIILGVFASLLSFGILLGFLI